MTLMLAIPFFPRLEVRRSDLRFQQSVTRLQQSSVHHRGALRRPVKRLGGTMKVCAIVSRTVRATALSLALIQVSIRPVLAAKRQISNDLPGPGPLGNPQSPVKHVIVII